MNDSKKKSSRLIVEEAYATDHWIKDVTEIVAPHGEEHEQLYMSSLNAMPAMHRSLVDVYTAFVSSTNSAPTYT